MVLGAVGIVVCRSSRQVCMHKEGDKFDHKTHILNGFNRLMVVVVRAKLASSETIKPEEE